MAQTPETDPLPRIEALTRNARNTWFVLLGALVFVGITLMGVEHIDFWGYGRATKLPLVDVEVPTRYFFVAAPILLTAIYGYFHLYLIRLWDALGVAPAHVDGKPLGDAVSPWLVTDAALTFRQRRLHEDPPCITGRRLDYPAMWLNLTLAWGFGLVMLLFLWWQSMTARTLWMTGLAGLMLFVSAWAGVASYLVMRRRMAGFATDKPRRWWRTALGALAATVATISLIFVSTERSTGLLGLHGPVSEAEIAIRNALPRPNSNGGNSREYLPEDPWATYFLGVAPIEMPGEQVVIRPDDWLPHDIARKDFLATWCKREAANCKDLSGDELSAFDDEWSIRRTAALAALAKPDLNPRRPLDVVFIDEALPAIRPQAPDLRGANLRGAFLSGLNLTSARLQGTDLIRAELEGAGFSWAQMQGAYLNDARMEGANLYKARMERADLIRARMEGANLREARMDKTDLRGARMQGADLFWASMKRADLRWAEMQGANLQGATMREAAFIGAQMEGANLRQARMEWAVLSYSALTGTREEPSLLQSTNLSAARNNGGALRFVDLTQSEFDMHTDFRNTFLDGSVQVSDAFRAQMGNPCQWHPEALTDAEFHARWRGWVEAGPLHYTLTSEEGKAFEPPVKWRSIAPEQFRDITPIPPDPDCVWKTGPMNGPR